MLCNHKLRTFSSDSNSIFTYKEWQPCDYLLVYMTIQILKKVFKGSQKKQFKKVKSFVFSSD